MTDARDSDVQVARLGEAGAREHGPTAVGHESRDVRIRPIAWAFTILFLVAVAAHIFLYALLDVLHARDTTRSEAASPLAASYGRQAPPEPRLQVAPRDDLRRLREREDALLHGYAWVDREHGVARIPIERAMDLVASRGLGGEQPRDGGPTTAAASPRSAASAGGGGESAP